MERTQIYLEGRQKQAVRSEAERRGITESAVIRECIDKHLADEEAERRREAGERFIEFIRDWQKRHPQGTTDKFDRESLYDR
jgi:hypothetical protein